MTVGYPAPAVGGSTAGRSGRSGRRRWAGLVSLLGVLALVGLTACSGDDDDAAPSSSGGSGSGSTAPSAGGTTASTAPGTTTTTRPPLAVPTVGLTVTNEGIYGGAEGTVGLGPEIHAAVLSTLNAYVQQASIAPLATGQAAQGLDKLFSAPAVQRLSDSTRQDRSTVTDEGLAPATTTLKIDEATVGLTGLADADGTVGAVAAKLSLKLSVVSDSGAYTISRQGDLTMLPFSGAWFIDGWNLKVDAAPQLLTNSPAPTGGATAATAAPVASTAATAAAPTVAAAPPAPAPAGGS